MLRVHSIFRSINGEINIDGQGSLAIFVRFSGCSVGCNYCDTKNSWNKEKGIEYSSYQLFKKVMEQGLVRRVTITGGEPLEQDRTQLYAFFNLLQNRDISITLETSGQYSVANIVNLFKDISVVLDYKLPSSGVKAVNKNFCNLPQNSFIKFIIDSKEDFDYALMSVASFYTQQYHVASKIYFSPSFGRLQPYELFGWMKKDIRCLQFDIGINLQIHKYIFPQDCEESEES